MDKLGMFAMAAVALLLLSAPAYAQEVKYEFNPVLWISTLFEYISSVSVPAPAGEFTAPIRQPVQPAKPEPQVTGYKKLAVFGDDMHGLVTPEVCARRGNCGTDEVPAYQEGTCICVSAWTGENVYAETGVPVFVAEGSAKPSEFVPDETGFPGIAAPAGQFGAAAGDLGEQIEIQLPRAESPSISIGHNLGYLDPFKIVNELGA